MKMSSKEVWQTILILLVAFILVVLSARFSRKDTVVQLLPSERIAVSCSPDFLSYQELSKNPTHVVSLISDRKLMHAANGKFINSEIIITKNETKESRVACGYLFVRAGTDTYGSLQSWENLYINPNEFGGHIKSENHIGGGDNVDYSEYLFPLSDMEYWKTRNARSQGILSRADWSVLLNVSDTVIFIIAMNTENPTAFIDELSIAYKCWNPATGEENDKCSLIVTKTTDIKGSQIK